MVVVVATVAIVLCVVVIDLCAGGVKVVCHLCGDGGNGRGEELMSEF